MSGNGYPERHIREISDRVSEAQVTAVEAAEEALEAIRRIDPEIRAFRSVWAEEALQRASRVDEAVGRGGRLPMAGVPFAVKGTERIDSVQVRRLVAAGAVPVGATSVPGPGTEWKTWGMTDRGRTVNPWRRDVTPGGSSAGAAAAVAAGMVPLATASDGAGSTRIPAAWCGVVGYKPTTGLLASRDRSGLAISGPIARSVAGIELYRQVVLGAQPQSAVTVGGAQLRVAWSATLEFNQVDPEVARVAGQAVRAWSSRTGLSLEDLDTALVLTDPAASWFAKRGGQEGDTTREDDARNRTLLNELFDSVDLLITPTTPNLAHGPDGPGKAMSVGVTWLFNLTGHPALSLPAGFSDDGRPVGVQLVAPHRHDDLLLAAAADFENFVPWMYLTL
ncbi:amidase [Nocardiopsis rhodophaea]